MKHRASGLGHLVKLVDTAYTAVRQNQGTRLKHKLAGLRIASDIGRQTDSR